MKFGQFFIFSAVLLLSSEAQAVTLSVAGGTWQQIVNGVGLQAGDNLTSTHESSAAQAQLTVNNSISVVGWEMRVRRTDIDWPSSDVILEVKRTSDGTDLGGGPLGPPTGGEDYIEITTSDTLFFSGMGNRGGIDLQFRLRGISVEQGVKDYSTEITYTVDEL